MENSGSVCCFVWQCLKSAFYLFIYLFCMIFGAILAWMTDIFQKCHLSLWFRISKQMLLSLNWNWNSSGLRVFLSCWHLTALYQMNREYLWTKGNTVLHWWTCPSYTQWFHTPTWSGLNGKKMGTRGHSFLNYFNDISDVLLSLN